MKPILTSPIVRLIAAVATAALVAVLLGNGNWH
jgi:hypothetical protein